MPIHHTSTSITSPGFMNKHRVAEHKFPSRMGKWQVSKTSTVTAVLAYSQRNAEEENRLLDCAGYRIDISGR
jgi:hypothetical protein